MTTFRSHPDPSTWDDYVDYESTSVGSREFLLPLRAEIRLESRDLLTRNQVEFRNYRKFASETTISFDPK